MASSRPQALVAIVIAALMACSSADEIDVCEHLSCDDDHIDRFLFRDNDLIHIEPLVWEVATEFVAPDDTALSDHEAIHMTFAWNTK